MGGKLKGMKELEKRLARMEKQVVENAERLGKEASAVGYKTAVSKVPVDSGELKNSIENTGKGFTVNADHGAPVEYGTFKTPAQPYFRPAYESMKKYVEENMGGVLDDTK